MLQRRSVDRPPGANHQKRDEIDEIQEGGLKFAQFFPAIFAQQIIESELRFSTIFSEACLEVPKNRVFL